MCSLPRGPESPRHYCRQYYATVRRAPSGDEVACPFHDWRWGGDGRCKLVPYARRTPEWRALGRGRPMRSGLPFGTTMRAIHPTPTRDSRGGQRRVDRLAVEPHPHRRVQLPRHHDNVTDMAHFFSTSPRFADVLQERLRGPHRPPAQRAGPMSTIWGRLTVIRRRSYWAVIHDQLAAQPLRQLQVRVDPDQLPLPGDPEPVRPAMGRHEKPKGMSEEMTDKVGGCSPRRQRLQMSRSEVNTSRIDNPLLVEEDGAVSAAPLVEQLYVDVRHKTDGGALRDRGRSPPPTFWNAEVEN